MVVAAYVGAGCSVSVSPAPEGTVERKVNFADMLDATYPITKHVITNIVEAVVVHTCYEGRNQLGGKIFFVDYRSDGEFDTQYTDNHKGATTRSSISCPSRAFKYFSVLRAQPGFNPATTSEVYRVDNSLFIRGLPAGRHDF